MRNIKETRDDYFSKKQIKERLQDKIYECNKQIEKLQKEVLKYENEINIM